MGCCSSNCWPCFLVHRHLRLMVHLVNEFGFEPYEDEPFPQFPHVKLLPKIRRVMPTFMNGPRSSSNAMAPWTTKPPPYCWCFSDYQFWWRPSCFQSSNNCKVTLLVWIWIIKFWAHAAAPYLKDDLINAFQTALQYPIWTTNFFG